MEPDCTPLIQRATPINIEKIFSLFIILFCGFLCALITLFFEKRIGSTLQSKHYSNGGTFITSKDKLKILLNEFEEDLRIANTTNSTLSSKLQNIQDLHNKCQCCRCNM